MFLQNNERFVADIFSRMGLSESEINKRLMTSRLLTNTNSIGADSAICKSGKGVGCGFDLMNGATYFAPVVVADDMEARAFRSLLVDADTAVFNPASSGAPLPLLTIWTNKQIHQIFKAMKLKALAGDFQQGTFGVRQIKVPVIGAVGSVVPYDDLSMNGDNDYNVTYVTRNIAYFETSLNYGELEIAEWSLSKLDAVGMKRNARDTVTIPQFQNDLGFNGYSAVSYPAIYGILNEPDLNPFITLPADGTIPGTTTKTTAWSGKDYSQILRDIQLLWNDVLLRSLGKVDTNSKAKLCYPPSVEAALLTSTVFGITVKEQLKKQYPGLEFVSVPNFEASLNSSNQTVVMLLLENPATGEMPFQELFTIKYMAHRPVPMASSMAEKVSMGLGGVMLFYPLYVSGAYGC